MASKDPEEPFNTETDEETIALRKKRLRRVSFADREITSVHIFNRDEEYETPPDDSSPAGKPSSAEEESEVLRFFGDLAVDSDDSKDMSPGEDDDDEIVARKSFLRAFETPSPGSTTIGSASATSNDEDNFFGPVSASFIRPRRLSDSAASDDNHDITMDSTAFSMHFRSIVKSESGDLKTPTGNHFNFEEKMPTQVATPSDTAGFMVLTKAKKPITQSPLAVDKVSGCPDSNEMSLVGENPHRFEFGRLSPTLEAILAEGSQNMHDVSLFDSASNAKSLERSEAAIHNDNGSGSMEVKDDRDSVMCNVGPHDMFIEGVPMVHSNLGGANGSFMTNLIDQNIHDFTSNVKDDLVVDVHTGHQINRPNKPDKVDKAVTEVVTGTSMPNVEFPGVNLPDVNMKSFHQSGLFSRHEPADLCSTENLLKENSSADGTLESHIDQLPDQQPGSPLSGSINLLSAKQEQTFLSAINSFGNLSYLTPPKQPGSFLRKESMKVSEVVSSIQKSLPKLKIMGSSPRTSALRDEIEKSKCRLSEYLSSATSRSNNVMEKTSKYPQYQHKDASVMNLEKRLLSADRKTGEHTFSTNMNGDTSRTPKNFASLNEETSGLSKDGESLNHLSILTCGEDKLTETVKPVASSSLLTSPGAVQHPSMSNNLLDGPLGASGTDRATNEPHKFVSSPMKSLGQKFSSPEESQGSLSGSFRQQFQYKNLVTQSGVGGNSKEHTSSCSNYLTSRDGNMNSFVDQGTQSSSPLLQITHLKDLSQVKNMDNRKIYPSILQKTSEVLTNIQTRSRDVDAIEFQLSSSDKNVQIANGPSNSKEELPGEEIKASPCAPALPYVQRTLNKPSLLKSPAVKESAAGKKEGDSLLRDHSNLFVYKGGLSSKSNSDEHGNNFCHQGLGNLQSPLALQDFENSSRRKRRSEETIPGDADNAYDINLVERSLKVRKSGGTDLEQLLQQSNGSEQIGGDGTLKHWTDISQKFSAETSQILSPLIEKLNRRAIGALEDILGRLQKFTKYETLCSGILFQKMYSQSSVLRHKRLAEIRLLLPKIAHEKAILQILQMKHEKLTKRVQLLKSGIGKFQKLKLNYVRHLSAIVKTNTQADDILCGSSLVSPEAKHEVASDKVIGMRQEIEALDRITKDFVKSFCNYCKIKGKLSCANTITLLNDNLKKRMQCRSLRQELQLWEIDDLEIRSGNHSLVLNYCSFISQRFTRVADPVSSWVISNKVNDINITKNFLNMDACIAFEFVFNAESAKQSVASTSLAQEAQTASSLLHNLLAVVEEVQLARIENRNLTQTNFNSPSAEQLNLQLIFIDFNSGRKVTMTLDLTCLNCRVYPSEILPYQLEVSSAGMQKSQSEALSSQIKSTICNLAIGYLRIIRLCRCVSQLLDLSSR